METLYVKDIAEIAGLLNGKVYFTDISFAQRLQGEEFRTTGMNNVVFVCRKFGVNFYTFKTDIETQMMLRADGPMTVLVGTDNSLNLYRIQ